MIMLFRSMTGIMSEYIISLDIIFEISKDPLDLRVLRGREFKIFYVRQKGN